MHLVKAQINCVQECGATCGHCVKKPFRDILHRLCEIRDSLWLIVECNHEGLVLRVSYLEELDHRITCPADLVGHAAAYIEDDAKRNGGVLTRKVPNRLLFLSLEDFEVFLVEADNLAVQRVYYRD
jgi:hypothetical protein